MSVSLESLASAASPPGDKLPPIELWQPDLSGDIDIRIAADGSWFHEGGEIKRRKLVRLFASILRREDDGEYYLVTPVEKWRIIVDWVPLMIIEATWQPSSEDQSDLLLTTNTGRTVTLNHDTTLEMFPNGRGDMVPVVLVRHGLRAALHRNVYYQLASDAVTDNDTGKMGIVSGGHHHPLEP